MRDVKKSKINKFKNRDCEKFEYLTVINGVEVENEGIKCKNTLWLRSNKIIEFIFTYKIFYEKINYHYNLIILFSSEVLIFKKKIEQTTEETGKQYEKIKEKF